MVFLRVALFLGLAACIAGCGDRTPAAQPAAERRDTPALVTFNRDIAPILYERCVTCHRPAEDAAAAALAGRDPNDPLCIGGAPFSLLDYRNARARAKQIAAATASRAMPPWLPEAGHGEFQHERRLTDRQIALIARWAEQGAPEGDAADAPAPPSFPVGWQLGTPDLVVKVNDPYTLAAGRGDVFRSFVVQVPAAADRYVRAIEFRADNPRVLHHANVAVDPARIGRRLDRADAGPGFAAMTDDAAQNVFGWSPGKVPQLEPAETAWRLGAGSDLIVQLHMIKGARPEPVQPSLGLFFSDTPPTRTPIAVKLESKAIDIPAGAADYVVEDRYVLPVDVEAVSVYPHAHYLAKQMEGVATLPDGTRKWLIRIAQWDVRWQDQYRYAAPLALPRGTTLSMRFTYDNSDANRNNPSRPTRHVKWGPESTDEMGALWLEVVPRNDADAAVLARDYVTRSLAAEIAGAELQARSQPRDAAVRNALATKYLAAGRAADARRELDEALRLDPAHAEAHSNLGTLLLAEGRMAEATAHLREAVRIAPGNDRLHFNLGNALTAAGRADEAAREYERAIRVNPDDAESHFNLAMILGPRNRLDEAVAHLRRVVDINPQNAEGYRNLGVALALQGKVDEAIESDRAALRLAPGSAPTQAHLDQLLRLRGAR